MDEIRKILIEKNVLSHANQGVQIAKVSESHAGLDLANEILIRTTDTKTALFLSGGKTPWELYKTFAREETLQPGTVGLIDERYGEKFHEASNERKLQETGFLRYLEMRGVPFYPILASGESREETADDYDTMLRELQQIYRRCIGILGIGLDGHTAGIAGNRNDFRNPLFTPARKDVLVSEFNDPSGMFKERITMTFPGLSRLDLLLILVFGEDKREALVHVFSEGTEEEVPARFYKRPEIAKKTLFITDQAV
jgi:6-phosphogluconolactonase/glucosamine-6-phosphate isomerase/deaminase